MVEARRGNAMETIETILSSSVDGVPMIYQSCTAPTVTRRQGGAMLAIIGVVVDLGAVVGGFTMEGGPPLVLIQPVELLIIGGAVIGGLLIAVPLKVLKILMSQVIGILGSGLSKQRSEERRVGK